MDADISNCYQVNKEMLQRYALEDLKVMKLLINFSYGVITNATPITIKTV